MKKGWILRNFLKKHSILGKVCKNFNNRKEWTDIICIKHIILKISAGTKNGNKRKYSNENLIFKKYVGDRELTRSQTKGEIL